MAIDLQDLLDTLEDFRGTMEVLVAKGEVLKAKLEALNQPEVPVKPSAPTNVVIS